MEKNKETKTLSPKLDVVFQALFGEIGNERITKGFLETILKRKIESREGTMRCFTVSLKEHFAFFERQRPCAGSLSSL